MSDLEFKIMDTFPKDGTRCDIKFESGTISGGWFYGHGLMGKNMIIRGDHNRMSPYLKPQGWRIEQPKDKK